ncbi:hypothetical protein FSB08_16910 [Paraburkholderia sp. JPY432]|uniref:hypothetical protein n=1 Tax=Paraburkholderia youngii TaxID=2782701 RepID=UPI00159635E7|nr:hypothetical protein [Paraburkholderia youngii]NVH74191.1 hypothetical protein [Paraburkholderia youngii]
MLPNDRNETGPFTQFALFRSCAREFVDIRRERLTKRTVMLAGQLSFQARKSKRDDQDGDKGSAARSHGVAAWHAPDAAGIPFTSDRPRHFQRSSFRSMSG